MTEKAVCSGETAGVAVGSGERTGVADCSGEMAGNKTFGKEQGVVNRSMITLEKIQQKLAEAIRQSGRTQRELAELIGVKRPQISCYLHGKKMPAIDTLAKLIAVLDADPADVLCLDEYAQ